MIECKAIETYLSGELSDNEAQEFRRHALICEPCHNQLEAHDEFQRWVVKAKQEFEFSTQTARRQIRAAVRRRQTSRRGVVIAWGVAASIAVMLALGPLYLSQSEHVVDPGRAENPVSAIPASNAGKPARVLLGETAGYLAVPVESTNPDVTIFWLHPTVESPESPDSSETRQPAEALFARRTS